MTLETFIRAQLVAFACQQVGRPPDPAAPCAKLLQLKTIFSPPPAHIMCPMIMADARTYLVTGTFLGKRVHESIVDGGCQLTR